MIRIPEKEVSKILEAMKNKSVEILIKGAIEVKQIINKLEYNERSGVIELNNKKTKEYTKLNLNEAYCTMTNKSKNKIQANIDSLNNDTVVLIKKLPKDKIAF